MKMGINSLIILEFGIYELQSLTKAVPKKDFIGKL